MKKKSPHTTIFSGWGDLPSPMLPYSFTILQILGFCRSVNWQKGWKTTLYDCYTYTMLFLLYTNAVFQSIYVFSSIESVDALIDNTFILLTTISSGFKATRFVMRREEIIRLLRIYRNHPCAPQDQAEEFIQSKYHRVIQSFYFSDATLQFYVYTSLSWGFVIYYFFIMPSTIFSNLSLCYISFTMATVTFQTSAQWRLAIPQRELIYKSWLPYDNSHPLAFWLSHVHQMICQFADASVSCTYGVIVAAMMINISGQFVILSHRLENLRESVGYQDKEGITKIRDHGTHDEIVDMERKKLAECIQHHLHIFDCFERSNDVFSGTMLGQYMASAFILCGTIYKVSKMTGLDPELIGIVMYLTCMLFDIFLPCYFGHEVTTESFRVSHGVYNMDWSELKIPTQKSLILIMNRSLKPLTFTSGYIVQLSLDSFGGLIKTSYSIFNLLKQQSN